MDHNRGMAGANPARLERSVRGVAIAASLVMAALWVAGGVLFALSDKVVYGNDWFLWGLFTLTGVAYVVSANLIVRRQPRNAIGWLLFLIAGALAASIAMTAYGIYAIAVSPGSLPFPGGVLAFAEPTPGITMMGIFLVLQLFPNGRPVGPRWRGVVWATVITWVVIIGLGHLLTPHRIADIWSDELSHAGASVRDPFGWSGFEGIGHGLGQISVVLGFATAALSIASLFVRRARADAVTRIQLRWLALVVGAVAGWILVMVPITILVSRTGPMGEETWASGLFWIVVTPLVALGIPVAVGIAIVRHRLLDIDVVIKKTVVFTVVAGVLLTLYLGVIALATVGTISRLLVAAILLVVTFSPVRRAARSLADRIVYGRRASSYEVLADFSERMGETYATDDVLPRMAEILARATGAAAATVWLHVGAELQPEATAGASDQPMTPIPVRGDELPEVPADLAVDVRHQHELLGSLSVTMPANDPLDPGREKLVRDLASQAGLVLRNVRLIEELKASRLRLVAAQDQERRRIERNIHDGAQQQLVAIGVKQRLLGGLIGHDDEKARELVEQLGRDTTDALEELRDLARGIYPPLLVDRGLIAALEAQARKAAVPTTVRAEGVERSTPDVEAAVYFCCLEALQNVAKYADANHAEIELVATNGLLTFRVADDGRGFDASTTSYGTGLQGIVDRLAALDGTVEIVSAPGEGTAVMGRLPTSPPALTRTVQHRPGPGLSTAPRVEPDR
jgi:signal transduction histidine kinase